MLAVADSDARNKFTFTVSGDRFHVGTDTMDLKLEPGVTTIFEPEFGTIPVEIDATDGGITSTETETDAGCVNGAWLDATDRRAGEQGRRTNSHGIDRVGSGPRPARRRLRAKNSGRVALFRTGTVRLMALSSARPVLR